MIQNQIRADTTLIFSTEAVLQGYECQKMLTSFFMSVNHLVILYL